MAAVSEADWRHAIKKLHLFSAIPHEAPDKRVQQFAG
jgi:hypothetical protein